MIARLWQARTKPGMGASYLDYFRRTGLREFLETPGFRGAYTLRRAAGDASDYLILSLWDDMDAVRLFAGSDPDRAVYYSGDVDYFPVDDLPLLLDHYEVVIAQRGGEQAGPLAASDPFADGDEAVPQRGEIREPRRADA